MSTLARVSKGFNALAAPQLIGADYATGSNEFWMMNQANGIDYKFSYTGHHSSLKALQKCPPLNALILKKAQAFVNGKTWIINTKGKGRDREANNYVASKVKTLLAKPNPFQSQKEWEAQLTVYVQTFGFCLLLPIVPVGFENYEATKLWNIPPSMIDIEETKKNWLLAEDNSQLVKSIIINFGNEKASLPVSQLWVIKDLTTTFNTPIFPESRICPLEMPINNIIGAYESRNVLINYRGALGIVSPESKDSAGFIPLKDDDKTALQQEFSRYGLKNNQWKFIISSAALKWTQMGVPTKDLMLFEEIEDDIQRICDGYGYQYELLSSTKGVTFANKKEAKTLFYQDTVVPEAESICEQLTNFFNLSQYQLRLEKDFSHVPALQGDVKTNAEARNIRNQAYEREFLNNVCTLDQWRTANGDDPLGDEFGRMYYHQLVAAGWKFGSSSSRAVQDPAQQNPSDNSSNTTQP